MDLKINPNWTFKEIFINIRALRNSYEGILCSFSCFNLHEKVKFIRNTNRLIYSLNFDNHKKNCIWEYLNHDIEYEVLQNLAYPSKKKGKKKK